MAELIPGVTYEEFVAQAVRFRRERAFRASPFFRQHERALSVLFSTPRIVRFSGASVGPPTLRLVHWNIEKGKALEGLRHHLSSHPDLREAQVYAFNEVDLGTARAGGNADIGRELATTLGCDLVFLPSFIECTKGVGEELSAEGQNELGLHGLAVLSRLPILDARMVFLPACFDYFDFHEKRFGARQGLYLKLEWRGRPLIVATTHLEVRRTPRCRGYQFRTFLEGLQTAREAWGTEAPVILTGDWNTNSFRRGGLYNAMREFLRIVRTDGRELESQLIRPLRREPLFGLLEEAGFEIEAFNDASPTASAALEGVEDLDVLPRPLARWIERRFHLRDRVLYMRLDWIAARGLTAASPPLTIQGLAYEGRPVSDHAAIVAEFR